MIESGVRPLGGSLGNPGGWTEERKRKIPQYKLKVVEMTARGMFLSEIGVEIGVPPRTITDWRKQDREFDEAFAEAQSAWIDQIEKEAVRRAYNGVAEPVVSAGRVVTVPGEDGRPEILYRRQYSDSLMMFILKGRRREVYGDKIETDNTHRVDLSAARQTLEDKLARLIEARRAAPTIDGEVVDGSVDAGGAQPAPAD